MNEYIYPLTDRTTSPRLIASAKRLARLWCVRKRWLILRHGTEANFTSCGLALVKAQRSNYWVHATPSALSRPLPLHPEDELSWALQMLSLCGGPGQELLGIGRGYDARLTCKALAPTLVGGLLM